MLRRNGGGSGSGGARGSRRSATKGCWTTSTVERGSDDAKRGGKRWGCRLKVASWGCSPGFPGGSGR